MSLTAIGLFESARRKFFMNSTQNMCKIAIKRFSAQEAEMSLTAITLFQQAR